jgi:hypothetical protein
MDWDKEPETHPSYGHAIFVRTTGHIKLFQSPLDHHTEFITLTISESERRHDLGRDWRFARNPIIEVAFSSAQFAQLLTTLNVGEGAPCTIRRINNKEVPPIPEEEKTERGRIREDFAGELQKLISKFTSYQKEIEAILEKRSIGKKDRELIRTAWQQVRQAVESNWPFVVEQFERSTTKLETAAKAEVEAVITAAVEKLGLQKLEELKKALPGGSGERKELTDGE